MLGRKVFVVRPLGWILLLAFACNTTLAIPNKNLSPAIYPIQISSPQLDSESVTASPESIKALTQPPCLVSAPLPTTTRKEKKESILINPKIKLALTTFSAFCVLFELLETLLEQVPLFHSFS